MLEPVRFQAEDGIALEGELRRPVAAPRAAAVVCHAHPRRGGSKDHPLLWAIRNDLAARGIAVLAFNFRGTMGSGGGYGGGVSEVLDVRAAVTRAAAEAEAAIVVGWSFGASVALAEAVDDERVRGLALIGLPLVAPEIDLPALPDGAALRRVRAPVLLLCGDRDRFCPPEMLRDLARRFSSATTVVVPEANHFFSRRERAAAVTVGAFADRSLGEPDASGN